MCGIAGVFGRNWNRQQLDAMHTAQRHRGPDADGLYLDPEGMCGLSHNRLSIIDLSPAGRQPRASADGRMQIILNGEIYNYLELRRELESKYDFRTSTDTEVLLAAFQNWGAEALHRLIGMFTFIVWDEVAKTAFVARDRFGVKPLYFHHASDGTLFFASEIKAIHAAGVSREPNIETWSTYLGSGVTDSTDQTFWKDVNSLPAGHYLVWKDGIVTIRRWYDLAEMVGHEFDPRDGEDVAAEYLGLMEDSVRLRFRSDVPVGINLSGGLDSSSLLSIVQRTQTDDESVKAFTFVTGDDRYDELPWVRKMIEQTRHPLVISELSCDEVPELAASVQSFQDEPYGGLPTLAYAKLFEAARTNGVKVLLDGNGMDEQWGGYDYYQHIDSTNGKVAPVVQGTRSSAVKPECLADEFRAAAIPFSHPEVFPDKFRNLQYRDTMHTKIPRAMRFNDRVSMRSSTELREPFLDHRLVELAMRQPQDRKRLNGTGKKMLREITQRILPNGFSEAPKRALQTPQREWLRGPLRSWADDCIRTGLDGLGRDWLKKESVLKHWDEYCTTEADNSFYVWQWITVGLMSK
jgi:asparagine synthase (glutamine-hydrolysing)